MAAARGAARAAEVLSACREERRPSFVPPEGVQLTASWMRHSPDLVVRTAGAIASGVEAVERLAAERKQAGELRAAGELLFFGVRAFSQRGWLDQAGKVSLLVKS